jgi:hypothetical protein
VNQHGRGAVGREWRENEHDVVVTLGRAEDSPQIDVNWIYAVDPSRIPDRFVVESSIGVGRLRYGSYFQCAVYDDWVSIPWNPWRLRWGRR